MRFTQPVNNEPTLLYNTVKIQGCVDSSVGFNLLKSEPAISKRRYCNKILVHECIPADVSAPMELTKVEFLATDDPCYAEFSVYKSSETVDSVSPTIELQLNTDDYEKVIGVLVHFTKEETCGQPVRLAYRLYGYMPEGDKILLSIGNLFITPCNCSDGTKPEVWTDIYW
jgi:hypothetical protein